MYCENNKFLNILTGDKMFLFTAAISDSVMGCPEAQYSVTRNRNRLFAMGNFHESPTMAAPTRLCSFSYRDNKIQFVPQTRSIKYEAALARLIEECTWHRKSIKQGKPLVYKQITPLPSHSKQADLLNADLATKVRS